MICRIRDGKTMFEPRRPNNRQSHTWEQRHKNQRRVHFYRVAQHKNNDVLAEKSNRNVRRVNERMKNKTSSL